MAGSGNGKPPRANNVSRSALYLEHRAAYEALYPRLKQDVVFEQAEAFMVICDPPVDARYLSGTTWLWQTAESPHFGSLWIYFTYAEGQIRLQNVVSEPALL